MNQCTRFDECKNVGKYVCCKTHGPCPCRNFKQIEKSKEQEAVNALAHALAETYWTARLEVIPDYKDSVLMGELVKTAVKHQWQRFVHEAIKILEAIKA